MNFLAILFCISPIFGLSVQKLSSATKFGRAYVRIIGGVPTKENKFPFSAAIHIHTDDGRYFCGGALISDQWILTSAHCIYKGKSFTIQIGSNSLSGRSPDGILEVTNKSVLHPDFNFRDYSNDIGLIQLENPVKLNDQVAPILLPTEALAENLLTTAIGWGQTNDQQSGPVDVLQSVEVITLENSHCKQTYGDQITDSVVCVIGNWNEGTCIGDNGSPLIQYNNFKPVHVGVSSFFSSNGCESLDPSGFVRTFSYISWIKKVTKII